MENVLRQTQIQFAMQNDPFHSKRNSFISINWVVRNCSISINMFDKNKMRRNNYQT